jgi:DNA-binding protein H-NS
MANANLASMSVDALLRLRENIEKVLTSRAQELRDQLARLGHEVSPRPRISSLKGRSVPIKYRDKSGNSWAGRGAQPVWLREKLKDGAKLEDFAVHKNAGRHNNAGRVKTRRRAKRNGTKSELSWEAV